MKEDENFEITPLVRRWWEGQLKRSQETAPHLITLWSMRINGSTWEDIAESGYYSSYRRPLKGSKP